VVVSKTILDKHANPMKYDDIFSRWHFFFKNPSKISFLVTQNLFQIFFWEIYFQNSTSYLCEVEKCLVFNNSIKLTNVLIGCDKKTILEEHANLMKYNITFFFNCLSAKY
jgi:hypothetical protein